MPAAINATDIPKLIKVLVFVFKGVFLATDCQEP
jgi:hypothetical protein